MRAHRQDMRPAALAALLVLGLAGCADCELEVGTYRVRAVQTSGNCGALGDGTLALGGEGLPIFGAGGGPATCTGPVIYEDDGCRVSYQRDCVDQFGPISFDGVTESAGTTSATGVVRVREPDCTSTYELTFDLSP
jgi:hypothetical protein